MIYPLKTDGADKGLDGVLDPSNPILAPPLILTIFFVKIEALETLIIAID